MVVNKRHGVHSKERLQTKAAKKGKSSAEQYEEFHNIDYSLCDSNKVEDRGTGKVKVIDVNE